MMGKIAAKYREQSGKRLTKEEGREWLTGAITRMKAQGAKGLRATVGDDDEEGRLIYLVEGWDVMPGSYEWPDPVFDAPVTASDIVSMIPPPVWEGDVTVQKLNIPDDD